MGLSTYEKFKEGPDPTPYKLLPAGKGHFDPAVHRTTRPPHPLTTFVGVAVNANSLSTLLEHDPFYFSRLIVQEGVNLIAVQEILIRPGAEARFTLDKLGLPSWWKTYFNPSRTTLGRSGTAVFAVFKAVGEQKTSIGEPETDGEGRVQFLEFSTFNFFNVYAPNPGDVTDLGGDPVRLDLRIKENGFDQSLAEAVVRKTAQNGKPTVMLTDFNVLRSRIDQYAYGTRPLRDESHAKGNASFEKWLLGHARLVDTFRARFPDLRGYTFWSHTADSRKHNRGLRLDYALVSESIAGHVVDVAPLPHARRGSDHCPLVVAIENLLPAPTFAVAMEVAPPALVSTAEPSKELTAPPASDTEATVSGEE